MSNLYLIDKEERISLVQRVLDYYSKRVSKLKNDETSLNPLLADDINDIQSNFDSVKDDLEKMRRTSFVDFLKYNRDFLIGAITEYVGDLRRTKENVQSQFESAPKLARMDNEIRYALAVRQDISELH